MAENGKKTQNNAHHQILSDDNSTNVMVHRDVKGTQPSTNADVQIRS